MSSQWATKIKVYLECAKEWREYFTQTLSIDDYFEGPEGEDRITYLCPRCREFHDSKVLRVDR